MLTYVETFFESEGSAFKISDRLRSFEIEVNQFLGVLKGTPRLTLP